MKKRLLLVAMLCSWMGMVVAQTNESVISADRPGMSTGTDVMPKGKIAIAKDLAKTVNAVLYPNNRHEISPELTVKDIAFDGYSE